MNGLPISVCRIAGAEARRISRALESVAGWQRPAAARLAPFQTFRRHARRCEKHEKGAPQL